MPQSVVITMVLVVSGLAIYAAYLLVLLWQKKREKKLNQQLNQQKSQFSQLQTSQARQVDAQNSIVIIARCLVQEQVSLTEAAIRISTLARSLNPSLVEQQLYMPFDTLAKATAHIPILDAWQQLPREEKKRLTQERENIEIQYRQRVMDAARDLLTMQ